jgi:hypothetical protein
VRSRFQRFNHKIVVDVKRPLSHVLPLVAKKFQIESMDAYRLYAEGKGLFLLFNTQSVVVSSSLHLFRPSELDLSKSVREQGLSPSGVWVINKPGDTDDVEDDSKQLSSSGGDDGSPLSMSPSSPRKQRQKQVAFDPTLLQIAAKGHKNPLMATNVQVKQNKKQKFESRFWVVSREKEKWIVQYKSSSEKKGTDCIEIGKFGCRVFDSLDDKERKSKEYQFSFELFNDKQTW